MPDILAPFTEEHLYPAVELFQQSYRSEQRYNPLLPPRALAEPGWIHAALEAKLDNPGVAVLEDGNLLAYMISSNPFAWKGQQAAIVHEYGHSAIEAGKRALYQRMYQYLAREWVKRRCHIHIIGHFAHDTVLQETLYQFGYGALLTERLRDSSAIDGRPDPSIKEEKDVNTLVDLHMEHIRYYPQSPIFLARSTDRPSALADLETHVQNGDVFFVSYEEKQPCAYLIVGESALGGEGFLLQATNTAQVKSAYAQPDCRGQGIGKAFLQHAIHWSQQQGYERVFVEHETANITGANFWQKYFSPYLYFSMRYVDNTL